MSVISELIATSRSGIVSITFSIDNEVVSSGSGFIYKNYLVSNNHVFNPKRQPFPANTVVGFRFGDTGNNSFTIRYPDLSLVVGSTEDSHDYSVYNIPSGVDMQGRHRFDMDHTLAYEGQQVMLMGYPFGSSFMTSHVGYVSAIYESAGVKTLQLDASVNFGNSGCPLIDIGSGKVIGIVTRKKTGLSDHFNELIDSFDNNIRALESVEVQMSLGGINPIDMLRISQRQMQHISLAIKRTSNVGIGYAFSVKSLQGEQLE